MSVAKGPTIVTRVDCLHVVCAREVYVNCHLLMMYCI